MSLRLPIFLCLLTFLVAPCVWSQTGSWSENTIWLQGGYYAYAGPGTYFTEDIAIRGGQMALGFNTSSNCHAQMEARIVGQAWSRFYDGTCRFGPSVFWSGAPTTPGAYQIEMRYLNVSGQWKQFSYDLFVVPAAQRAFSDGLGNSIVYWQGTTYAIDNPLLVAEGIDASNMNYESAYYALGADLFGLGQSRGADVLILNFNDGGADLRTNAEVLESAILYLNQIKTGSRKLDVAGVSMGGVVARYTLADMEARDVAHNVGRFVSIDGPQQGAVLDLDLQEWIYYSDRDLVPAPDNLTSMAGKQLLKEDLFDLYTPSQHDLFYDELNALNGDGYPHQTIENVGVSFGTPSPNPHTGQEWLTVHLPIVLNPHFHVEAGTPEAEAGSWLPLEVTDLWGKALRGFSDWEFDRLANPTFIPYDSALDRVNGVSRFDYTLDADAVRYHNVVPEEIVEPLLIRLGYPEIPPPPLAVSISGPTSLPEWDTGTWHATIPGDACTGTATCRWERRTNYPGCPGDPGDPTRGLPCGSGATWLYSGTGGSIQRQMPVGALSLELRVEATRGTEHVWDYHTVVSTSARQGAELQAGVPVASASAEVGLPLAFALGGAHPNPFNPQTVLRFAVPEASVVRLSVFDALGREVTRLVDGRVEAGHHEARFDGSALPSGVYLVRLAAGAAVATMRLTLLK